ncbi:hypothetical protein LCGC14_0699290 [marine sediment metagenome]|uniref:Uncharacterized protein n=1 Tax=marine sediment metagenome TaxID=412755 RepID=A0A0F9R3Q6_9ZZZZ
MKGLLRVLADGALMGCGVALTYIFVSIGILGRYGMEPNSVVLALEIISSMALVCLGLYMLIQDVESDRRRRK